MAAKGIRASGKGVKMASDWGIEGAKNHPVVQGMANNPVVNNPVTRGMVNNPVTRHPATRVIGSAAGLMGGLALAGGRGSAKVYNNVNKAELKTVGNFIAGFALV